LIYENKKPIDRVAKLWILGAMFQISAKKNGGRKVFNHTSFSDTYVVKIKNLVDARFLGRKIIQKEGIFYQRLSKRNEVIFCYGKEK
jgi:hypothetical protein